MTSKTTLVALAIALFVRIDSVAADNHAASGQHTAEARPKLDAKLFRRDSKGESVEVDPIRDSPITARLIVKRDRYELNPNRQLQIARYQRELDAIRSKRVSRLGVTWPRQPCPTVVELALELKNTSRHNVKLRFDDFDQYAGVDLKLKGPGSFAAHAFLPGPGYGRSTNWREVVIAPGKTHRIDLRYLKGIRFPGRRRMNSGFIRAMERSANLWYWTKPGEYTLSGTFWARVRPSETNEVDGVKKDVPNPAGNHGIALAKIKPVSLQVAQASKKNSRQSAEIKRLQGHWIAMSAVEMKGGKPHELVRHLAAKRSYWRNMTIAGNSIEGIPFAPIGSEAAFNQLPSTAIAMAATIMVEARGKGTLTIDNNARPMQMRIAWRYLEGDKRFKRFLYRFTNDGALELAAPPLQPTDASRPSQPAKETAAPQSFKNAVVLRFERFVEQQ